MWDAFDALGAVDCPDDPECRIDRCKARIEEGLGVIEDSFP